MENCGEGVGNGVSIGVGSQIFISGIVCVVTGSAAGWLAHCHIIYRIWVGLPLARGERRTVHGVWYLACY